MVAWTIFKNQLLKVGITQNRETMTPQNLAAVCLLYSIMCEGHVWIKFHWITIQPKVWSHMTSHYTRGAHDHTTWFWKCRGTTFGHLFWALTVSWSHLFWALSLVILEASWDGRRPTSFGFFQFHFFGFSWALSLGVWSGPWSRHNIVSSLPCLHVWTREGSDLNVRLKWWQPINYLTFLTPANLRSFPPLLDSSEINLEPESRFSDSPPPLWHKYILEYIYMPITYLLT
jgi:hypothetical protein